jgi:hypothetical protein
LVSLLGLVFLGRIRLLTEKKVTIRTKKAKHGKSIGSVEQEQPPAMNDAAPQSVQKPLEQSGDEPERRSLMATETRTNHFEMMGMAKMWKEGYLKGLEASLQFQEQNEQLMKHAVRQGLSAYQLWLAMYKSWLGKPSDHIPGQTTAAPFFTMTRQILETSQGFAEPLLKSACETSFEYYETAVAGPARKYAFEINKKVLDTLIPT